MRRESREQERFSPSPSHGGLDLSQEVRISLPTTPAAFSRTALAYSEAAVAFCDTALADAGGRGSPAADDIRRVPSLLAEAEARSFLAVLLHSLGEEQQRSLELIRQAVALWRQVLRTAAPGAAALTAQRMLARQLSSLGGMVKEMVEIEACNREALALVESLGDVALTVHILTSLVNLCGEVPATVGRIEAEAFRSRLNQCLVQMGRSPETNCSICLEPLASRADGAAEDAAGVQKDSCVHVLRCTHQLHFGCLSTWWSKTSSGACPLCKE